MEFVANHLSLTDQGNGNPTLVFLHYFGGAAASWQWVARELEPDFRCIALDLPGFGLAPPLQAPSLREYSHFVCQGLTALNLSEFVLVGHSMGGKIALQVAVDLAAHESVGGLQKIILIAPSPPTQEPMPDAEKQRLLSHHPSDDNARTTVDKATRSPLSDDQYETAVQTHTIATDSAWQWWLQTGMNNSIADQMKQVQVPVAVIASQDDPVIPYQTIQQEVISLLPDAQLAPLSDIGHLMPLERPDLLGKKIRECV